MSIVQKVAAVALAGKRVAGLALVLAALGISVFALRLPAVQAANIVPIQGYAWSSNIGWVHFNGSGYGVQEDTTTGELSGYAWSQLGWITFNASDLSGCPSGSCTAKVDPATGQISGWARVCAAFSNKSGCSGALDAHSGGWDGWVHLSGTATDGSVYGVTSTTGCWSGFAWGSTNVGAISFYGKAQDGSVYGVGEPTCNRNPVPTVVWLGSTGCVLPTNGAGCDVTADWVAKNLPTGQLVDLQIQNPMTGVTKLFTGLPADPTQAYRVYAPGTYVFTLFEDKAGVKGAQIGTTASVAVCPNGYTLDTSNPLAESCVAPKSKPQPTVVFYAKPSTIGSGQSTQLYWSSSNATACNPTTGTSGFSTGGAAQSPSGGVSTGVLTKTTSYSLVCTGPGGTSPTQNVTVTVVQPTVSISVNPDRVPSGNSTTVSWTASNVSSCSIARNGQSWTPTGPNANLTPDKSGNVKGNADSKVDAQTTFDITCSGAGASATVNATAVANVEGGYRVF